MNEQTQSFLNDAFSKKKKLYQMILKNDSTRLTFARIWFACLLGIGLLVVLFYLVCLPDFGGYLVREHLPGLEFVLTVVTMAVFVVLSITLCLCCFGNSGTLLLIVIMSSLLS